MHELLGICLRALTRANRLSLLLVTRPPLHGRLQHGRRPRLPEATTTPRPQRLADVSQRYLATRRKLEKEGSAGSAKSKMKLQLALHNTFTGNLFYGHGNVEGLPWLVKTIVTVCCGTLFVIAFEKLLMVLVCVPRDGQPPTLLLYPSVRCWSAHHRQLCYVAMVALL